MQDAVRFTSQFGRAKHLRLLLGLALRSPLGLALRAAAVIAATAFVLVAFAGSCGGVPVAAVFAGATAVIVAAFILVVDTAAAAAIALMGRNERLYVPLDVVADDEGLALHTDASEGRVAWRAYVKWRRLGDVVLLYQTGRSFNAFDLSEMPAEDRERFLGLVRRHVGERG